MSAILGVFGADRPTADAEVAAMLEAMGRRGDDAVEVWRDEGAVLAVSRYDWELEPGFSGNVLIGQAGDLVIAADASLYYREDLVRGLASAGVRPRSDTPSHLILAAYQAWGEKCLDRLEGDYAFIVWDRARRRAFAARDFGAKRPLHYAELGRELVIGSSIGGVVAHPRCPTTLNLPFLAGTCSGMHFTGGPETCYEAVRVFSNAHQMRWEGGRLAGPTRYWDPPVGVRSTVPFDEAAQELRHLLKAATLERMTPGTANAVWLSGGWDSTAIFGAANDGVRLRRNGTRVVPVSMSYPEGDPGREDEIIQEVAAHWHAPIHWQDIRDIPYLDDERAEASKRDEPFLHPYHRWNRALARESRAAGARVALDGMGGDHLFQNSDIFLADLFRSGRWIRMSREWRARPRGGFRDFFAWAVQPNMTPAMHAVATRIRGGRRLRHYLERPLSPWAQEEFVARHSLDSRDHGYMGRALPVGHADREIDWQHTNPFIARIISLVSALALEEGVEMRSPLWDRRVMKLALSRPWSERSSGRETKRLLRAAVHGLLPDHVLAPRTHRTGITSGYAHRWMSNVFPGILKETMESPLVLEGLGVVDGRRLRTGAEEYLRRPDATLRLGLFFTLQTELWLRAHVHGRSETSHGMDQEHHPMHARGVAVA